MNAHEWSGLSVDVCAGGLHLFVNGCSGVSHPFAHIAVRERVSSIHERGVTVYKRMFKSVGSRTVDPRA